MSVASLTKEQELRELKISSSLKKCTFTHDYRDAKDVKELLLKTDLEEKFFEGNVMLAIFCIFDTLLFSPEPETSGIRETNIKIDQIFKDLRRIGAESAEGYALMTDFDEVAKLFIIKISRHAQQDGLYHEYFIGAAGTNNLRRKIPNYAYILGTFKCLPPTVNPDKSVSHFCGRGDHKFYTNYVIYEKIPGVPANKLQDISLKEGVVHATSIQYLSWIIQIAFALQLGVEECDFTHYDLHDDNALLRPFQKNGREVKSFYIPYPGPEGQILYVKTNRIVTFIDYGRSHIMANGQHFGVFGYEQYGVYHNKSRPWYDFYKVVMFSLYRMKETGNKALMHLLPLIRIMKSEYDVMTDEQLLVVLEGNQGTEEGEFYEFSPTITKQEKEETLWDALVMIENAFPKEWSNIVFDKPNSGEEVLRCEQFCPSVSEVETSLTNTAKNLKDITKDFESYPRSSHVVQMSAALSSEVESKFLNRVKSLRVDIVSRLDELSKSETFGLPRQLTSDDFQGLVSTFIEPNIELNTLIESYQTQLKTLQEHHTTTLQLKDIKYLELPVSYGKWKKQYAALTDKFSRMIVPANKQLMKTSLLEEM
jgi:hypothetical protein